MNRTEREATQEQTDINMERQVGIMQKVAGLHHIRFETDNFEGIVSVAQTVLPIKCYVLRGRGRG